jgi:CheY-like chemotaxis protein
MLTWRNWFQKRNEPSAPAGEPIRILAVCLFLDDRFVLDQLGDTYGWQLRFANSPREAFRLAFENDFDLILCDRNQPGHPWREVMDRLAASSPRSCILLVSPMSDDYLWWEVLQHGGFDVLIRPLRAEIVLRAIETAAHFLAPLKDCSVSR